MKSGNLVEDIRSATDGHADPLGRGLGVFSLALGAGELVAPRQLGRAIGVDIDGSSASSKILRAFGAREIAAGLAVLLRPNRQVPLWGRVAGDVLDIVFLGLAMRDARARRGRLAFAAAAVLGVAALDIFAGLRARERTRLS